MQRVIYLLAAIILFMTPAARAHQNIVENDTTICPGASLTLHGLGNTVVPLYVDDQFSTVIPIGFPFTFYGNTYTKLVVSSNGYVCFDTSKAGLFSAWAISTGIPGNNDVKNCIMGHYADIYPATGSGVMDYGVVGTAPNRKFVVSFCSIPMFSCNTLLTTFQIVLNEFDNTADVHIRNKPTCTGWNSGYAIEGVQDATGTYATAVPGRNVPGTWTATNSSHKFTATSATNYTVAAIPFAPIVTNGYNFIWYQGTPGGTPIATTQNVTVTPTTTTKYYLRSIHCSDTAYDSITVFVAGGAHLDSATHINPTQCGSMNGQIRIYGLTPNHNYTLYYTKNGVAQGPIAITSNNIGQYVIAGLGAAIYTNIYVIDAPCISNALGPITLTNPSITASYNFNIKYGCSQDTVQFVNNSQTVGGLAYTWDFGDGTSSTATNPTHIYTVQGTYNVRLIANNTSNGGGCADTIAKSVNLIHPLSASFTVSKDSGCSKQDIVFTNTSVATTNNGVAPQYLWSFGDGTTSTQQSPTHSFNYAGTYNVRMVVTNFVPCSDTAYHTIVIDSIPFVNFTIGDTSLCQGHQTLFTANLLNIGLTKYEWSFSDGGYNLNTNPVLHSFDSAGVHSIKLTAHYRLCPDTNFTATVTVHPYPGINLGPDTAICPGAPGIPLFDHLNSGSTGLTYLWNTGATTNGITALAPGTFSATVSQFGCATTDTVEVLNDCYINIPNIFTPNGDGANDYFFPRQFLSSSVAAFKMDIYNRWGELIYSTNRTDGRGWDGGLNGKPQPDGVYIYSIDVVFLNGKKEHHQGNVTLLR